MKTEELKHGQTVYVKGIITDIEEDEILDLEIHTSENNFCVNSSDVYASPDQPKPVLKKEHAEWLEELKNEFPDNLPNQLYHITRQGWGYGLVFESNTGQKIKISNLDNGKLKKDLVNALIYGYTIEKEKLYRVKLNDHLYFKEFIDSMFPVFVIDDMPGDLDEAFIGKKELALKHAREFGGRLEEVEEVTE
ncbi:DUF1642 domain-containing protein [Streptococcus uberis]|uniref:DUF1642 domain-containing protein n=1 Tax=Streptococcus uberis TaxID=1349 RepID=UPI001FF28C3F|nr:DUF1642 domain-containing protein [Streptococcus uberis]MCK1227526.1 DUF1642 domain-containing protein [Streptococcus uberis]